MPPVGWRAAGTAWREPIGHADAQQSAGHDMGAVRATRAQRFCNLNLSGSVDVRLRAMNGTPWRADDRAAFWSHMA